ncbi:hypothetical protein [Longimicrobium sp.]|uniref:hypothetical protein n=1 Tax=Longimicrobium sp. TaxID=2029185 RepID=UPI003B3A1E1E
MQDFPRVSGTFRSVAWIVGPLLLLMGIGTLVACAVALFQTRVSTDGVRLAFLAVGWIALGIWFIAAARSGHVTLPAQIFGLALRGFRAGQRRHSDPRLRR